MNIQRIGIALIALLLICAVALADAPDAVVTRAIAIIGEQESGHNYGCVYADTNGAPSIGFLQWNAERAVSLMKAIIAADEASARSILGDTLTQALIAGRTTMWNSRTLTAAERKAVSALLKTDAGKAAQDAQAKRSVTAYVEKAMALGIVDRTALCYYADILHQVGSGNIGKYTTKAAEYAGSYASIELDDLYRAALVYATHTKARRERVYRLLKADPVGGGESPITGRIDKVTLNGEIRMTVGEKQTLTPTWSPETLPNPGFSFKSVNPRIAGVNQKGVVLARRPGIVTIKCRTRDGSAIVGKLRIRVSR